MSTLKFSSVLAVGVCVATVACGSTSPVGPGGSSRFFGTGGAVITGHVNGAPPAATAQSITATKMAATTLTVTIVGTDITSAIDGQGNFELTGVPPGDVQLKFSRSGASAVITLSGVAAGDRIHIVVTLNGNDARVDADDRDHDDDDGDDDDDEADNELKGLVSNLTGTCPSVTFTVQGVTVVTNTSTKFEDRCARIANGRRVEVEGTRQANGSILATEVEID